MGDVKKDSYFNALLNLTAIQTRPTLFVQWKPDPSHPLAPNEKSRLLASRRKSEGDPPHAGLPETGLDAAHSISEAYTHARQRRALRTIGSAKIQASASELSHRTYKSRHLLPLRSATKIILKNSTNGLPISPASVIHPTMATDQQPTSPRKSTSPSASAPNASGDIPRPKRIACVVCRKRKLRCDGNKPSCGTCSRLGHDWSVNARIFTSGYLLMIIVPMMRYDGKAVQKEAMLKRLRHG